MVEALLARYGYLAILALLVVAGLGVPAPEEPTQLLAGVLAQRGILSFVPAVATCWVGIVAGDLLWFLLVQRIGPPVLERTAVRKVLTPARRARVEAHLARHAFVTVMVTRHLSALRLAGFALAATHGVRVRTFVIADALSALASVPLVVTAGYLGAHHLSKVRSEVRTAELAILGLVALGFVAVLVARRLRRRRGPADEPITPRRA